MSANFTPSRGAYTELKPFRFWCQKVLPLVYDESLSYYELLCKVVDYLNKTMEDVETLEGDVTSMYTAYEQLQSYVNNYFDQNFPQLVSDKLDEMAEDGTLTALITPVVTDTIDEQLPGEVAEKIGDTVADQIGPVVSGQIGPVVSNQIGPVVSNQIGPVVADWLEDNVSATTPAVDRTLSILNAAADAAFTGARVDNLDDAVGYDHISDVGAIITTAEPYAFNYEYINDNAAFSDNQSHTYKMLVIPVTTGDKYRINAHKISIANVTADHFAVTYAFCAKYVGDPNTDIPYYLPTTYNTDAVVDDAIVTVPEITIPTGQYYDETTGYLVVITADIEDPVYKVTDGFASESEVNALKDDLNKSISNTFDEIVYADSAPVPTEWEYGNIDASGANTNDDRVYYARFKAAFVPKENMTLNVKKVIATGLTNYVVVEYDASTHAMTNRTVYQVGTYPNIDVSAIVGKEYRLCFMCSNSITIDLNNMDLYATVTTDTQINKIITELSGANAEIAEIKEVLLPSGNVEQLNYTANAGYTAKSGTAVPGGTTYAYTNKIAVKPGDVIRGIAKNNGGDSVLRFIAAFNGNTAVPDSGAENVYNYTVPDGIDGLVLTGYQGTTGDVTSIPNFYKFTDGFVDKKTDSNGFVVKNSSVTDGDNIIIPLNNVSKNVVLSVDATVDAFSSLEFGRTKITEKIVVTSENVIFYDSTGAVLSTTPHGLTIENTISIRIVHNANDNVDQVSVIVASNGVIAEPITKGWTAYRSGNVYVKSVGSVLTDCSVSFAMGDINKALWLFGDSYCSITFNRWVGQLNIAGYLGNILLNAYPGESAAQETPSFINLVNKGNPKAIVWACGMNDNGDANDHPSSMWLNAVSVFITACESRGIIPILATIPTVPTINNEQKNAWIRNSGKRYIDFAKAVGANSSGVWYNDMLSNDGIHPTEKGAIALFNRALADCPELMEK